MSSFGEISEPISRTNWEDWDDSNQDIVNLHWAQSIREPQAIDCLTIFEGTYLSDFIQLQSNSLELINTVSGIKMNMFKFTDINTYICTIKDYNVVNSSKIIELLKDYLVISREVLTIQTKPLPEYQTMMPTQDCVIRAITTSKSPPNAAFVYPKLEQPNIISGVSAGVICWREHMNLSATAIVCYIENPGDYQIDKIQKLLQKFNFSQNVQPRPCSNIFTSNLYI